MAEGLSKVRSDLDAASEEPARRVAWIDWDSGFREGGLRVGDRLLGDVGGRYDAEAAAKGEVLGGAAERRRWERLGLAAGDVVAVEVERGGEVVAVEGRLVENRTYRDAEGRRSFGEDGPAHSEKDGFDYAWHPWYARFQDLAETVLAGWDHTSGYDTRRLGEQLEAFRPRIELLAERYPGAFARAARHDLVAMDVMLAGEPRQLSEAELAYRQLGEIRAARVSAAADAAWEALHGELGDSLLRDPFPAPDPFEEDTSALVGRTVELPDVGDRDLLRETARSWYRAGGSQGSYLVDRHGEAIRGLFAATDRYVEKVDPHLESRRIRFVGDVEAQPALVVDALRNVTVVGLRVRPLAALVRTEGGAGGRFFVDLRPQPEGAPEEIFAGEAGLLGVDRPRLAPELAPRDVLGTAFRCLQVGDFETWLRCFADWKVRGWHGRGEDGAAVEHLWVDRTWTTLGGAEAASVWDRSRRHLLDDVYALEVARVEPPRVVYDAAEQPEELRDPEEGPRLVEEVRAVVDHVGSGADGGFRTFAGGDLHRRWTLQRLDDGPWRITSGQPI